jgi:hypothetical protein
VAQPVAGARDEPLFTGKRPRAVDRRAHVRVRTSKTRSKKSQASGADLFSLGDAEVTMAILERAGFDELRSRTSTSRSSTDTT